ncbi:MAG: SDR family oxidoreductase [Acidobacteriia bacterium]|nr:SDR family oxidoreductase [Terriglobia bacterium]
MIELKGQIAVVTGGGRGLGRAFAQTLAAAGASVAVIARDAGELNQTVASAGGNALAFPADVTDAQAILSVFAEIGPVDLLINNAGVLGPIGPFWEMDFDQWWRAMDINVRGAQLCTRAVLPGMIARRRGRIINIVTGAVPAAYLSPYLTSKTALVRATECLAAETKPYGVALFSVAPGTVRTDMSMHSVHSAEGQKWIPWFRRVFEEHLDLPPERPAQLVLELASGKADALSGLYLTPFDDLDAILKSIAQVETEKLHSLRIRALGASAATSAIAAIRDAAERA